MADPFDYVETRADADELIQDDGQAVSIRRLANSGAAWDPTQTPADTATYGARIEFSFKQLQSGNISASDQRWLVAAGPLGVLVPTPFDKIVIGGVAYDIVRADPTNPAGIAVMYDVQVRA